jgi:hypothetical protein
MLLSVALVALTAGVTTGIATAGNGAVILTMANTPNPAKPLVGTGYNFVFWNGNGQETLFTPTYYQEVLTPSGVNNEVLKGRIANDTGQVVTYSANSGAPIPAGQTCWDFATGNESTHWQMTIDTSRNYTLNCHFGG